jgi:MFS family permease
VPLLFIFITAFVDLLGYGMVVPLLPFYVERQQAGAIVAGSLGSLYALMQFISNPILGALSDRYGRRPVLLLCLCGTMFAYVILGFADSLTMIFVAIILDGITGGNLATAQAYIADITEPNQRARGLGLVGVAIGLGLMMGPVFGGLLSYFDLRLPAFTAALIALSNITFGYFVLKESLPPEKRAARRAFSFNPLKQLVDSFRLINIRALLVVLFTLNLAFSGLQTNFPLYAHARFNWDATRVGFFFAFVGVCAVFTQGFLIGRLQPRVGEGRLTLIGLALMAASLTGVAIAASEWMLYPLVGSLAVGSGLSIPSVTSLISQRVGDDQQGKVMGDTQALISLNLIIGPALAGIAFESFGTSAPYWLGSAWAMMALIFALKKLS